MFLVALALEFVLIYYLRNQRIDLNAFTSNQTFKRSEFGVQILDPNFPDLMAFNIYGKYVSSLILFKL